MPVGWSIRDGLVRLVSEEEATFEEWRDAIDAALADSHYSAGMAVLHDVRRMRRVPSAIEAQQRVDVLAARTRTSKVSRWATVVDRAALYGTGRMGEAFAGRAGVEFRVFKDPDKAEAWARGDTAA
jgi:hypothetical protein